jgi:hypothetical protein
VQSPSARGRVPPSPMLTRTAAAVALTVALSALVVLGFTHAARTPRSLTLSDLPGVVQSPPRGHHARARHSSPAAAGEAKAKPGGRDAAPASAPRHRARPRVEEPAVVLAPDPAVAAARAFVRDYYAALDGHDFGAAWGMLSPEVQRAFGGFARWRAGYAHTVSHSPSAIRVAALPAGATVGLTLRAGDRGACGRTVERSFAVTWRLARTAAGWRATAASARKLGGPEPC